jgi:uncharacterized protein with GYD domain
VEKGLAEGWLAYPHIPAGWSKSHTFGGRMSTYIVLVRWTNQGLQKIKESPSRLEAGKKAFAAAGIKQTAFYMVMGRYDMVTIAEAPDDATLAKGLLSLASQGNFQTETLRAFTEDEYKKIISAI